MGDERRSVISTNNITVNKGGTTRNRPKFIYHKVPGFLIKSTPLGGNPEYQKQMSSFHRDERESLIQISNSLSHASNMTAHGIPFTYSTRDNKRNNSPVLMSDVTSGKGYETADSSFRYIFSQ